MSLTKGTLYLELHHNNQIDNSFAESDCIQLLTEIPINGAMQSHRNRLTIFVRNTYKQHD